MPRWTSFALMAATALVAAPVGSHYLSQDKPPVSHVVERVTRPVPSKGAVAVPTGASTGKSSQSDELFSLEQDALDRARIDIAGLVCGFASQHVEGPSRGCSPASVADAEIMVAILPDPVHTQLALRFDRGIDNIENELGQLGWVYDRSWLPWENVGRKPADRWQDQRTDDHLQRAVETLPGVLLFRGRKEGERKPLIVLLVGDAPTGGVNAEQFSQAIGFWRQPCGLIHQTCLDQPKTNLPILGPTFSGSMPSLHQLLHANLPESLCTGRPLAVTISSGTVSDSQTLEEAPALPCASISIHQETLAVDAGYLAKHLHQYTSLIANLSERETSYGGRPVFSTDRTAPTAGSDAADADRLQQYQNYRLTLNCRVNKVTCAEVDQSIGRLQHTIAQQRKVAARDKSGANGPTVTNLTFPRGISRLRRAYEQSGIVGFTQTSDAPKTQLELSSADDDRNDDTVPNFSGSMNALSMEAEMASLAKTLVTEHYAAVLLSASDVMDEIFVARYLAQHAPDVTVVVMDADQLFLREGQEQSLQNVYSVAVWPLIERNIIWSTDTPNDVHVFPSQGDQGTAAAVQHLVCAAILKQEVEWPCSARSYREYRPPFVVDGATNDNKLEPPVWLSVIGHGGFLPVALLDLDDTTKDLPELSELSLPRLQDVPTDPRTGKELPATFNASHIVEAPSQPLKVIAALLLSLVVWHGVACLRCRLDRPFAWTYARAERQQDGLRLLARAVLSLVGMLALSLLYLPDQQPVKDGSIFSVESNRFHLFLIAGMILAALLSSLSIWKAVQVHTRKQERAPHLPTPQDALQSLANLFKTLVAYPHAFLVSSVYFMGLLTFLALSRWNIWWVFAPSLQNPSERIFFIYRASLPLSGASPLLPLLLMGGAAAVWLYGIFSQLAFFGHRIPKLPDGFEAIRCPSNRWVKDLNQLLSRVIDLDHVCSFVICLLVAGVVIRLGGSNGVESFSHGRFAAWITLGTWVFSAAILQDLLTATRAWQQLRHHCLIPLKQSPLRWGFTWVKGFSWKRIWTSSKNLSSNQVFDYLLRLLETNERVPQDVAVKACYDEVYEHYHADPKDDEWLEGFTTKAAALHNRVKAAAEQRLGELQKLWVEDAGPLTGTDELRGVHMLQKLEAVEEPGQRASMLKRMGSEEFVALLYVGYISMVLIQIRHRIVRAAVMYILLMWALTCYPWMYRHTILIELCALLIVLSGVTLYVYSQMHRDEILSRTTETETGKLDSGFFEKVVPVIGLPLLTLIASQFPEFSNLIFSWLQPGLSHIQ